jgi:hypothetical protein
VGSTLLALDAGLNLERNFAGNRDWAFRFETAKPEWTLCFATVQVKENREFLLQRKVEIGVALAGSEVEVSPSRNHPDKRPLPLVESFGPEGQRHLLPRAAGSAAGPSRIGPLYAKDRIHVLDL